TVELTNGSYRYTVISGNSSYRAMGGELSVNGSGGAVTVGFVPEVYAIEFAESGLPNGTVWWVTVAGVTAKTNGTEIVVKLGNGSYAFSVGDSAGYGATPSAGVMEVTGPGEPTRVISFEAGGGVPIYLWVAGGGTAAVGVAIGAVVYVVMGRRARPRK
ncbi:hypothetical protein B1A_00943, partial [mine drainage metagenome]